MLAVLSLYGHALSLVKKKFPWSCSIFKTMLLASKSKCPLCLKLVCIILLLQGFC